MAEMLYLFSPVLIAIFIGLPIVFIKYLLTKNNTKKQTEQKHSTPLICPDISKTPAQKPDYDFFTENTVIDADYLQKLIDAQRKIKHQELSPYDGLEIERIIKVEYNPTSRMSRVTYEVKKYYKTIERYVQQNYQRYPVYSDLKSKTRQYTKSYKLTNKNLENLHNEFEFSNEHLFMDLIVALNSPSLVPYMFFLKALGNQLGIAVEYDEAQIKSAKDKLSDFEKQTNDRTKHLSLSISKTSKPLSRTKSKAEKITTKLQALEQKGKHNPKSELKLQNLKNYIQKQEQSIEDMENEISSLNASLEETKKSVSDRCTELNEHIKFIQRKEYSLLKKFKPLQTEVSNTNDFVSLDALLGIEYKKIVGCYVIRNTEKDKYYVGQSKDVLRRLKQHFKGTVPSNPIFAEDYYTSNVEDKSKLFEVKIIELQTKDELDRTEKDLIEQYDCFYSGYNGTHGNT